MGASVLRSLRGPAMPRQYAFGASTCGPLISQGPAGLGNVRRPVIACSMDAAVAGRWLLR